jgi:hypothetical protein
MPRPIHALFEPTLAAWVERFTCWKSATNRIGGARHRSRLTAVEATEMTTPRFASLPSTAVSIRALTHVGNDVEAGAALHLFT